MGNLHFINIILLSFFSQIIAKIYEEDINEIIQDIDFGDQKSFEFPYESIYYIDILGQEGKSDCTVQQKSLKFFTHTKQTYNTFSNYYDPQTGLPQSQKNGLSMIPFITNFIMYKGNQMLVTTSLSTVYYLEINYNYNVSDSLADQDKRRPFTFLYNYFYHHHRADNDTIEQPVLVSHTNSTGFTRIYLLFNNQAIIAPQFYDELLTDQVETSNSEIKDCPNWVKINVLYSAVVLNDLLIIAGGQNGVIIYKIDDATGLIKFISQISNNIYFQSQNINLYPIDVQLSTIKNDVIYILDHNFGILKLIIEKDLINHSDKLIIALQDFQIQAQQPLSFTQFYDEKFFIIEKRAKKHWLKEFYYDKQQNKTVLLYDGAYKRLTQIIPDQDYVLLMGQDVHQVQWLSSIDEHGNYISQDNKLFINGLLKTYLSRLQYQYKLEFKYQYFLITASRFEISLIQYQIQPPKIQCLATDNQDQQQVYSINLYTKTCNKKVKDQQSDTVDTCQLNGKLVLNVNSSFFYNFNKNYFIIAIPVAILFCLIILVLIIYIFRRCLIKKRLKELENQKLITSTASANDISTAK